MIVLPVGAAQYCLDRLIDSVSPFYHLFVNDIQLGPNTTAADFIEASFAGYVPLGTGLWANAYLRQGIVTTLADALTWTCTRLGPLETLYGYWVTDGIDGAMLWCELASPPLIVVHQAGDQVQLTPLISLSAQPSVPVEAPLHQRYRRGK